MEAAAIIAAINLIEQLIPIIDEKVKSGQVSPEEQTKIRDRYTSLRNLGDALFAGPEWHVE